MVKYKEQINQAQKFVKIAVNKQDIFVDKMWSGSKWFQNVKDEYPSIWSKMIHFLKSWKKDWADVGASTVFQHANAALKQINS